MGARRWSGRRWWGRLLVSTLIGVTALGGAACDGGGDGDVGGPSTTRDPGATTASTVARSACEVVSAADVEASMGIPVEQDASGAAGATDKVRQCAYAGVVDGAPTTVTIRIEDDGADGYDAAVKDVEDTHSVTARPLEGVGDRASVAVVARDPGFTELTSAAKDVLVTVRVVGLADDLLAEQVATDLVVTVIARLRKG